MICSHIDYAIDDSVTDKLKTIDMAVFCVDKNSELVTFTESKLGPVSFTCTCICFIIILFYECIVTSWLYTQTETTNYNISVSTLLKTNYKLKFEEFKD